MCSNIVEEPLFFFSFAIFDPPSLENQFIYLPCQPLQRCWGGAAGEEVDSGGVSHYLITDAPRMGAWKCNALNIYDDQPTERHKDGHREVTPALLCCCGVCVKELAIAVCCTDILSGMYIYSYLSRYNRPHFAPASQIWHCIFSSHYYRPPPSLLPISPTPSPLTSEISSIFSSSPSPSPPPSAPSLPLPYLLRLRFSLSASHIFFLVFNFSYSLRLSSLWSV